MIDEDLEDIERQTKVMYNEPNRKPRKKGAKSIFRGHFKNAQKAGESRRKKAPVTLPTVKL